MSRKRKEAKQLRRLKLEEPVQKPVTGYIPSICPKCLEPILKPLNRHHIVPRRFWKVGNDLTILLCLDCHKEIDDLLPQRRMLSRIEYWNITCKWLRGEPVKVL